MGVQVPLNVNVAGRYVFGATSVDVKGVPSLGCGATQSVSGFSLGYDVSRPKMTNGVTLPPDFEDGA